MIKHNINIYEVVEFLNELLVIDKKAINNLFSTRFECNEKLAAHPTVQAGYNKEINYSDVGILGILNGLFGANENGWGAIAMIIDGDQNNITSFSILENRLNNGK